MLLRREATAQRDKRCSKSHILDQNPSFGVRRTVIYIFKFKAQAKTYRPLGIPTRTLLQDFKAMLVKD